MRWKLIPSTLQSSYCTDSRTNGLLVLGVETSCDDTGAAVVNGRGEIVGEALHSQTSIHVEYVVSTVHSKRDFGNSLL